MRHALRYEGGYERNFHSLTPGKTEYEGDDGETHKIIPWPAAADGLRYGFMEQKGKRFFVVRVCYGDSEILLKNPVRIDPDRHTGGHRFSAEPVPVDEEPSSHLLGDIITANPEQRAELSALRDHVRGDMKRDAH